MSFPKGFKSFAECEKYFADKNAGIFHGDTHVIVRILSNDDKREEKCIYAIHPEESFLEKISDETSNLTGNKPETIESSVNDDFAAEDAKGEEDTEDPDKPAPKTIPNKKKQ